MSSDRDDLLRRALEAAHRDEPIPSFERVLSRPRRRSGLKRLAPLGLAALLAAVVALPIYRAATERAPASAGDREAYEFALELARWRAPSDRLVAPDLEIALFRGLGEPSVLESTEEMVRWR